MCFLEFSMYHKLFMYCQRQNYNMYLNLLGKYAQYYINYFYMHHITSVLWCYFCVNYYILYRKYLIYRLKLYTNLLLLNVEDNIH